MLVDQNQFFLTKKKMLVGKKKANFRKKNQEYYFVENLILYKMTFD